MKTSKMNMCDQLWVVTVEQQKEHHYNEYTIHVAQDAESLKESPMTLHTCRTEY